MRSRDKILEELDCQVREFVFSNDLYDCREESLESSRTQGCKEPR